MLAVSFFLINTYARIGELHWYVVFSSTEIFNDSIEIQLEIVYATRDTRGIKCVYLVTNCMAECLLSIN